MMVDYPQNRAPQLSLAQAPGVAFTTFSCMTGAAAVAAASLLRASPDPGTAGAGVAMQASANQGPGCQGVRRIMLLPKPCNRFGVAAARIAQFRQRRCSRCRAGVTT